MSDQFPDRIDSKFRYVLLTSARAEQIMRGARPKTEVVTNKPTSVAMKEVNGEMLEWGYGPSPADREAAEAAAVAAVEAGEEEVH